MYKAKIDFPVYDNLVYKEFKKGDVVELKEADLMAKLVKSGRCEECSPKVEKKVVEVEENKVEKEEAPKTAKKTTKSKKK